MEILAAMGGLIALVIVMAWLYAKSSASGARSEERSKIAQKALEARDAMDKAFAKPLSLGKRLRDRMRDRSGDEASSVSDSERGSD